MSLSKVYEPDPKLLSELGQNAPLFVGWVGKKALEDESNAYHLAHINRLLWCSANYIPTKVFDQNNSKHVMTAQHCGGWRKPLMSTISTEKVIFGIDWTISHQVDHLKTRNTDYFSKETENVQHNASNASRVEIKSYLLEQCRILRQNAENSFQETK